MKQLTFLLFLLTFVACSKDEKDETTSFNATDLKGTWNLASISCTDGATTSEILGQKIASTFVLSSKDHKATLVFSENPNSYESKGTYTSISTITTFGQTQTEEIPLEDFNLKGTWKLDGKMLIISQQGEPDQKAEITKLDAKNLEYKFIVDETTEELGLKVTTKGTLITKLTR